ncbi:PilC/PilY family type IV pilus protein [Pseudomonas jinjuensis]|uniref:Type IV pilus assembly protein PilY1 n=1 Tax=Pseudomonas jinjuensis TaxID=198616 RepID=A0A1H0MLD4_9PSED|nr:PilC/PilY family type IV pilus protein [Pseudomonas jinjuensis]SDO81154.1 type IV pilus assembly protein PilY1 [Pseudomonas jinjuensis]
MKAPSFLCSAFASALATATILYSGISYADDTEIFFGGSTIDAGIRPNVLFILDDSGSMNDNKTPTRMAQLKSAFNTIIHSAGSINVGVMALNTKSGGSRLLSPVRPIDESINVKLSSPVLLASGDDASYFSSGTTNINDPTLVMGYTGNNEGVTRSLGFKTTYSAENTSYYVVRSNSTDYACSSKIADKGNVCPTGLKATINSNKDSGNDGILLFRNLNIPAGVSIQSAKLVITRATTGTVRSFSVKIENTKTAAAFNNDDVIGSERNYGNSDLNISSVTPSLNGEELTFDLKNQLQKLKDLSPAANPIGDISVRLRGTGSNNYSWYLGDGTETSPEITPRLEITWTGSESTNRTTGLRFQNVAIPKDAIITSARIDFVPAASDDRPVTFSVTAQNSSDANIFTADATNFTGRPKTANSSTWTPAEWRTTKPQVYVEGPTVTALVQTVVNNNDWCGNNSMAFFITPTAGSGNRTAFSVDAAKDLQPVLNVKYEGGDEGCLDPILDISVVDNKDDGYQESTSQGERTPNLTSTSLSFSNDYIVSRYQRVPVKQGATVKEAQIIVTPNNANSGTATVNFHDIDNSPELNTNNRNLSDRFPGSGGASCSFPSGTAGIPVTCSAAGIKTQLQAIFSRPGWSDGNALSLLLKPSSGSLALKSRDSGAGNSIVLRVKLASGGLGANSYTVRDYTDGIVQSLSADGNTPIVPALHEAAGYLTRATGKHVGTVPSPITSSCQANYLVLLTDGEANNGRNSTEGGPARTNIASMTGRTCTGDASDTDEQCGRTLVTWLATEDQADYDGLNTVTTHTIGFNTSNNAQATSFLNSLATLGGGKAYSAENAGELASAFDDIVQAALATNTTFVNTSAPVNTFNRADNRDELYFALFRPSESDRWVGNLKRYRLATQDGVATIVDADDAPAIDANTGFFKTSARSFWSATQDGSDVAKGGAAFNLPTPANRKLFTYLGDSPAGTSAALENLVGNDNITATRLGDSTMTTVERAALIEYISGVDTDESGNKRNRQALGDPIHSSPRLVTYGCNAFTDGECTDPDLSAFLGTNEGFIHAFNTNNGAEQFAFMPEALLRNIRQLRNNAKSTANKPRLYGMDNTVTVWVNDANNNGVIYGDPSTDTTTGLNTNEFVYAYATMGRGGRNIYALDVTDRSAPRMLWQILGGTTPGFEKLGQTWSTPVKTRIRVGDTIRDVLIFGGGYDEDQDDLNISTSVYAEDDIGNAIYIVDARTGEKLWSASNGAGHDKTLEKMKFSIPSSVRVIDIQQNEAGALVTDPDKLADQFFVGDMGGQVWRFYINNGSTGAALVTPGGTTGDGVFASIGGTTPATARRFYNEPDVALLNVGGSRVLTVNIGSGYRGHPLNEFIEDRFYSFRTTTLFKTTGEGTLTETGMYDATQNLLQAGDDSQKTTANTAFQRTSGGWFITLTNSGEKVLSRSLTASGTLFFNTYEPSTSTTACSAAVGKNRSYAVRLLDATPASIEAGGDGTPSDRAQLSNSGGISGDPQLFCTGDNCWILPDPAIDPVRAESPPLGKTYWIDSPDAD